MAVENGLPEGFEIEQPSQSASLPEGFELENKPPVPDTAPVQRMVGDNLAKQKKPEDGPDQEPLKFHEALDAGTGMPISSALGKQNNSCDLTPEWRAHLMDAYENGTAVSAGDYMQSAVPAAAHTVTSSMLGAGARGAARSLGPIAAGFAAFGSAAEAGAAAALPFSELAGPLAPAVPVAAGLVSGLAAAGVAGYAAGKAQQVALSAAPKAAEVLGQSPEQVKADIEQHPTATFAGELAPNLLFMRPGSVTKIGAAVGLGLGGTQEAVREKVSGEKLDPAKIAMSAALLGIANKPTRLGEMISPGLRDIVASNTGKPPEKIVPEDILQAIHMAFDDKLPKAQSFVDTAKLMNTDPANLRTVYKETGKTPSDVFIDSVANPDIAKEVSAGSIPSAYEGLVPKRPVQEPVSSAFKQTKPDFSPMENEPVRFQRYKNTAVSYQVKDDGNIHIESLQTPVGKRGIGGAKSAMNDFISNADEQGKSITVDAVPLDDATDPEKLVKFYESLGFKKTGHGNEMVRDPAVEPSPDEYLENTEQAVDKSARTSGFELHPTEAALQEKYGVPEEKTSSQLGKIDADMQRYFSGSPPEGFPKIDAMNDEEFAALDNYARRVEKARSDTRSLGSFIKDESGSLNIPEGAVKSAGKAHEEVMSFFDPMSLGSSRAQASAKDFANSLRKARALGAKIFERITEEFTPEESADMWRKLDESSDRALELEKNGIGRAEAKSMVEKEGIGHFSLPEREKAVVQGLNDWAENAFDRVKKYDMIDSEGIPFWTPRMAAVIGDDGTWGKPPVDASVATKVGKNLTTSASSLKHRKYETAEETAEAMKAAFGGHLVEDIRTMPLALARLEQAIAGKKLINEIKQMGKDTGVDTVRESPHDGFFTLDHPALKKFSPRLEQGEDGKWNLVKDEHGNPIFDKKPVYISNEFKGPLEAVLSKDAGTIYKGIMVAKSKAMGMIMFSPMIHNMVVWGRAFPTMPGKVLTGQLYFEGNAARQGLPWNGVMKHILDYTSGARDTMPRDLSVFKEALDAGLVPIGQNFQNQDVSAIMSMPDVGTGKGWIAKTLGVLGDVAGKKTGDAVRNTVDSFFDVYHNKLLWDRVADLQMGLYINVKDRALKSGLEPIAAQRTAAHIANLFTGAMPQESMSDIAKKLANVAMFSRSYTLGNLGVLKDATVGLPSDIYSQLERDVGKAGAKKASSFVQRKAIAATLIDMGLFMAGNSLLQDAFDHIKRNKSLDQITRGYVDRLHKFINEPSRGVESLFSTAENEPGKEGRIHYSDDNKTGTAYYMRFPVGKVGEESLNWIEHPFDMARKKLAPIPSALIDILQNKDYFGHPVYDENARGISGKAKQIGQAVTYLMSKQVPEDTIKSLYNLATGAPSKDLDLMKTVGPLTGFTFSKGYPGGPEAGIIAAARRRHEGEVSTALPKIKDAVTNNDYKSAYKMMDTLGMSGREKRQIINHYSNPSNSVNAKSLKKFEKMATDEEKELMSTHLDDKN